MPEMRRSVSHRSGNGAEIYVAQPGDRLVDRAVSQRDAEGAVHGTYRTRPQDRDSKLTGQRLDWRRALRRTGDHGAPVGFAEQKLVRREACGVRRQIHVEAEPVFLIRSPHRDFREGDAQPTVRTVVRRTKQSALGAGDKKLDETLLDFQIHPGRLTAQEIVADLPVCGAPQLAARLAENEYHVAARARMAWHRAVRPRQQPDHPDDGCGINGAGRAFIDRKSTRLNSSHVRISYAVFCLKKKKRFISTISYATHRQAQLTPSGR